MTTVQDLVTEALVTVKALAVGESAPPSMSSTALKRFNEVQEALSLQNLAVFRSLQTTFPLVVGTGSYTIGPTGAVVAQRPPFLETAYVRFQGIDYEVKVRTEQEYARIALKTQPGLPEWLIYDPGYPNGTIVLWPVPDQAATLTVYQNAEFTQAATLFDVLSLPPGYRQMMRLLLAWSLVTDYPGMSGPELEKLQDDVQTAVALVKRNSKKKQLLRSEVAQLPCSGGGYGNWRTGQ